MIKGYEQNKVYAEKLAELIANNPDMRVIVWIDTYGIDYDYCCVTGNIYEPHVETMIFKENNIYYTKENNPLKDCVNYYGWKKVYEWTDKEIEEKAKQIPWEKAIVVRVGVN